MTAKSHLLEKNPVQELEVPSVKKSLPRYLTLEESLELLSSVEVKDFESARDYCMITLFLNCGMRLSEPVSYTHLRYNGYFARLSLWFPVWVYGYA